MKHILKSLAWTAFILLLIGGCFGQKHSGPKTSYYVLEYASPQFSGMPPLPTVLQVERFQVAPFYRTERMVYREDAFKRNAYPYHKWRVDPGELVAYFLARDIRQSHLFKGVLTPESVSPPTHIIEGSVEQFYEHDATDQWEAILSISIVLVAANEPDTSRRILFQKTYTTRRACSRKNPQALAAAMSHAMSTVSGMIIADIYGALTVSKPPANRP